jgi:bifunctional DNase/RNase
MEVRSVGFDRSAQSPVVLLQDHDRRRALPIWIGTSEAQSIAMQLQGITPPRPMTHDLMKSMMDGAGIELQKVVIDELRESTYHARLQLTVNRKTVELDSRPSDAIALALRCGRPIFVAASLLDAAHTMDVQRDLGGASLRLGHMTIQNLTAELADYFGLQPGRGVLVADVGSGRAALQRGDVIIELDGTVVTGLGDFEQRIRAVPEGSTALLGVQRAGKRLEVTFDPRGG